MTLLMEGVLAVQAGSQPRLLGERLRAMVPSSSLPKGDAKDAKSKAKSKSSAEEENSKAA